MGTSGPFLTPYMLDANSCKKYRLTQATSYIKVCYKDTQGSERDRNLRGLINSHQSGFKTALDAISTQHLSSPLILITNQVISLYFSSFKF